MTKPDINIRETGDGYEVTFGDFEESVCVGFSEEFGPELLVYADDIEVLEGDVYERIVRIEMAEDEDDD